MTDDIIDDQLLVWLKTQRSSLQALACHIGTKYGDEAIKPLLVKQLRRQAQGASFHAELSRKLQRLHEADVEIERRSDHNAAAKQQRFATYSRQLRAALAHVED